MDLAAGRARYVFNKLTGDYGYSPQAAAGLVGNFWQESAFSDDVLSGRRMGDKGTSFGLAQWRGDRLTNLRNQAKKWEADPRDLDTQIKFVDWELKNRERGAYNRLLAARTTEEGARAAIGYERPRGWSLGNPTAGHGWDNRLMHARNVAGQPTGPMYAGPDVSGPDPGAVAMMSPVRESAPQPGMSAPSPTAARPSISSLFSMTPATAAMNDFSLPEMRPQVPMAQVTALPEVTPRVVAPGTPDTLAGGSGTDTLAGGGDDMDAFTDQLFGAPGAAAPAVAPDEMDDFADQLFTPAPVTPAPTPAEPAGEDPFGRVGHFFDQAGFGLTPYTRAAGRSIEGLFTGDEKSFGEHFADVEAGFANTEKEHPIATSINKIVGPTVSSVGGLGVAGNLAMRTGRGIASAWPSLGPGLSATGKFLTGQAGAWRGAGASGAALRGASTAATGAMEGAGAGAMQTALTEDDVGQDAASGAFVGALAGPLVSAVGTALTGPLRATVSEETKNLLGRARGVIDESALPRGGQLSEQESIRAMDKRLFEGKDSNNQLKSFTTEAMKTTGSTAKTATPEVVEAEKGRIGNFFEAVINNADFKPDAKTFSALGTIQQDIAQNVQRGSTEQRQLFSVLDGIRRSMGQGTYGPTYVNGKLYQDLTSAKSPLGRMLNGNNDTMKQYAGQIKDQIEESLERHMAANGNKFFTLSGAKTSLSELYKQARTQWKNISTVEDAMKGNYSGVLDPVALQRAAEKHYRSGLTAKSDNNMPLLARLAQFMPKTTAQGSAAESRDQMARITSTVVGNAPQGAFGAGVGAASFFGGFSPLGAAAIGAGAFGAAKARDKFLANYMRDPAYRNLLLGDTEAARRVGAAATVGRRTFIGAATALEKERER